jgi:hypothetical protein
MGRDERRVSDAEILCLLIGRAVDRHALIHLLDLGRALPVSELVAAGVTWQSTGSQPRKISLGDP